MNCRRVALFNGCLERVTGRLLLVGPGPELNAARLRLRYLNGQRFVGLDNVSWKSRGDLRQAVHGLFKGLVTEHIGCLCSLLLHVVLHVVVQHLRGLDRKVHLVTLVAVVEALYVGVVADVFGSFCV